MWKIFENVGFQTSEKVSWEKKEKKKHAQNIRSTVPRTDDLIKVFISNSLRWIHLHPNDWHSLPRAQRPINCAIRTCDVLCACADTSQSIPWRILRLLMTHYQQARFIIHRRLGIIGWFVREAVYPPIPEISSSVTTEWCGQNRPGKCRLLPDLTDPPTAERSW